MDINLLINQFELPLINRPQLEFCPSSLAGVQNWCAQIPMANTGAAAKLLFQALPKINQWQTTAVIRLQILDVVRPHIHQICHQLQQHYSVDTQLEPRQIKIANLNRALQLQILLGYEQVVAQSIRDSEKQEKLATALHRSFSAANSILLESLSLYTSPPGRMWRDIHGLLQIAEVSDCLYQTVVDPDIPNKPPSRVLDPYLHSQLLSTCRPNNLRPTELLTIQHALGSWTTHVEIVTESLDSCLFIVDLEQSQGAGYRQHMESLDRQTLRGINTSRLVHLLKYANDHPYEEGNIEIPTSCSSSLLQHVMSSWGVQWQRTFDRIPQTGDLNMAIGMAATHYFNTGQIGFKSFTRWQNRQRDEINQPATSLSPVDTIEKSIHAQSLESDIWANAFDTDARKSSKIDYRDVNAIDFADKQPAPEIGLYPLHTVQIINASTGGYCIHWTEKFVSGLQSGELVACNEEGSDHWHMGILRWIKRDQNQGMLGGVELLSNRAESAVVTHLEESAASSPRTRALILPEISSISQPASIILPNTGFTEGQTIALSQDGFNGQIQLTSTILVSSSVAQYMFQKQPFGRALLSSNNTSKLELEDEPVPNAESFRQLD